MALQPARLIDAKKDGHLLQGIAQIHEACIMEDGTMATFLPPLELSKTVRYRADFFEDDEQGRRLVIVQCVKSLDAAEHDEQVVGVVSLGMPTSQTGPFRSTVEKLLVSPSHRYKGIARSLMAKLEQEAMDRERWLVILDTTIGSGAEHMYPKLGYTQLGIVPNYGFSPKDGNLLDEVFFYKDLR